MPRLDRLPLALIVLDGWGQRPGTDHNAIRNCGPENMEDLASNWNKAAGSPPVFPYVGFVMPTLHLIYGNPP